MRSILTCLATMFVPLAAPAVAQDIGLDFSAAYAIFGNRSEDSEAAIAEMEKRISLIEGRWVRIDILLGDNLEGIEGGAIDDETMTMWCNGLAFDLTREGPRSFVLRYVSERSPDAPQMSVHYGYTGFNSFQRFVYETEFLSRMGNADGQDVPPNWYLDALNMTKVNLYHPSADIMVMVTPSGLTEYYARCPVI